MLSMEFSLIQILKQTKILHTFPHIKIHKFIKKQASLVQTIIVLGSTQIATQMR